MPHGVGERNAWGKQLLGAAVRLLAELRTDDDADLLKGTGENVSNFVTLQDNGLHLMYACWKPPPQKTARS